MSKIWQTIKKFNNRAFKYIFKESLPSKKISENILEKFNTESTDPYFQFHFIEEHSKPFELSEWHVVLNHKSDTAEGIDKISYSMLKELPLIAKKIIINKFNNTLQGGDLPIEWKNYMILGFLKKQRDSNDVRNFRPLAISSCVLKILEGMIKNRLEWRIEKEELLSKYQMGFRRGKGIWDNIVYLTTYVQAAFSENKEVIGILLDIKQAYDNVDPYILYRILINYEIEIDLVNLILKILTNKKYFIKDNIGDIHGPINSNSGLPQVSPLSPILFNLYISSLIKTLTRHVRILSFADDIILIIKGKDPKEIVTMANKCLEKINKWLINHKLNLAKEKCEIINFSSKVHDVHYQSIKIENSKLTVKN